MAQHILFDLDGTLTDPFEGITGSIQYALEKMGITPPPKAELLPFIGPPLIESFSCFYGMDEATAVRAVDLYREYFRDRGIFENALYEGVPEMLAALTASGRQIHLATSKPLLFATQICEHFGIMPYFTSLHGAPMDSHGATKAKVIEEVLREEGISPEAAVMVGDRDVDMTGAAQHGVASIGVLFGYGSHEELTEAGAGALAATVQELSEMLLNA